MLDRRPTCLSETNMLDQRPIGTFMSDLTWSSKLVYFTLGTFFLRMIEKDPKFFSLSFNVYLMGLQSSISASDGSPTRHVCLRSGMVVFHQAVGLRSGMLVSDQAWQSPMDLRSGISVYDEACWSPMRLRRGMPVSDGSPTRHVGIWWVSDRSSTV